MTILRSSSSRGLKTWHAFDDVMCGQVPRSGSERAFAKVPRLRLLFAGLTPACKDRHASAPDDLPLEAGRNESDGSWWQTGFPFWTTL